MTDEIPKTDCPDWLRSIANNHIYDKGIEIPFQWLLKDSLFCPLSGLDHYPIKKFQGRIHSFVFAEHESSKEQILSFIKSIPGYSLFDYRSYECYEELEPNSIKLLQTRKTDGRTKDIIHYLPDPDPCAWAVLKRDGATKGCGNERNTIIFLKLVIPTCILSVFTFSMVVYWFDSNR